jgi:hypothetical protein
MCTFTHFSTGRRKHSRRFFEVSCTREFYDQYAPPFLVFTAQRSLKEDARRFASTFHIHNNNNNNTKNVTINMHLTLYSTSQFKDDDDFLDDASKLIFVYALGFNLVFFTLGMYWLRWQPVGDTDADTDTYAEYEADCPLSDADADTDGDTNADADTDADTNAVGNAKEYNDAAVDSGDALANEAENEADVAAGTCVKGVAKTDLSITDSSIVQAGEIEVKFGKDYSIADDVAFECDALIEGVVVDDAAGRAYLPKWLKDGLHKVSVRVTFICFFVRNTRTFFHFNLI